VPEKPVLAGDGEVVRCGDDQRADGSITHTLSTTLIGPDGKVARFYPGNEWTAERQGVNADESWIEYRKDAELDFLSLGALVHRLDPGIIPFRKATECQIHVSGGEFNVAANLSDCFGMKTAIASAMSDYPIGDLIAERVRAMGVKPFYKHFKHDGVTGPNMATVYSDRATACALRWSSTTAATRRRRN
jgi:hypothetical protein